MTSEERAAAAVEAVKKYIAERENTLAARIKELEDKLAALPVPKDGKDGASVTIEDVTPILKELISSLELPKGEKGDKGDDGLDGENGKDGTSVSMEDVSAQIERLFDAVPKLDVALTIGALEKQIGERIDEAVSKIAIPQPRDGEDGRDALDLEVLAEIDEEKSYRRGMFARHKGGLFRSFEQTRGMRGWECIVDGVDSVDIEFDGERGVKMQMVKSSGDIVEKAFTIPALVYRGIYKEDDAFQKGDAVTYGGSLFIALKDAPEGRPETSQDWKLAVKRGRDGAEVVKVPKEPKTVKLGG